MSDDLFNLDEIQDENGWRKEWKDMPEYINDDLQHDLSIILNFQKPEDMVAFGKLIGQNITPRTKFAWYPKAPLGESYKDKYYTDES
jgi:hypothetical protein